MFVMGDEVRRTQQGNNNAYCQDNEISWFVRALLRFRRDSPFCGDERFWARPGGTDVRWHGIEPGRPDRGDTSHSIAFELQSAAGDERIYDAVNASWTPLEFTLPALKTGCRGRSQSARTTHRSSRATHRRASTSRYASRIGRWCAWSPRSRRGS
jgi:isoamylase